MFSTGKFASFIVMSRSEQHNQVALLSVENEAIMGVIVNRNIVEVDFARRQTMLHEAQEVLRRVAQSTKSVNTA